MFLLHESATGYILFECSEFDSIGADTAAVQQSVLDISRFGKIVKLAAFQPFKSAAEALGEINSISEGLLTEELQQFLERSLPKVGLLTCMRDLDRKLSTWCWHTLKMHQKMHGYSTSKEAALYKMPL